MLEFGAKKRQTNWPDQHLLPKILRSQDEICRSIGQHCRNKWAALWTAMPPAVTAFKSSLGPTNYSDIPRQQQVSLTRLRLGVTLMTHRKYFTGNNDCITWSPCGCSMNIRHLLISCPAFALHRAPLKRHCRLRGVPFNVDSLASPEYPVAILIDLLVAADYMEHLWRSAAAAVNSKPACSWQLAEDGATVHRRRCT